ncbi:MAG: hypothetical protein KDC61_02180 [Saprospiraceae bacterium]|nr:hypothetical protein [Saprospiraceae bacterium]
MKRLNWVFQFGAIVFLATICAVPFWGNQGNWDDFNPIGITMVICSTLCFICLLGLMAWQHYVDTKKAGEAETRIAALEKERDGLQQKISDLIAEYGQKTDAPKIRAYEILQLAEKLRTKTTTKDGAITDEVPKEIRDFIINNFPKS